MTHGSAPTLTHGGPTAGLPTSDPPRTSWEKWVVCVPEVSDMQPLGAKVEGTEAPQESGSQKMSLRPTLKRATCTEPGARRDILKQTPAK